MAAVDLTMPALGQSVAEGTVVKWLKRPGDAVARDESIVAIQTDKAEAEVPSPVAGTLSEVLVAEGTTVEVGTVLGRLAANDAAPASAPAPRSPSRATATTAALTAAPVPPRVAGERFLSPAVRHLARESGVALEDLASLAGSGRGGRLTLDDLARHLRSGARMRADARAATGAADVEVLPLTGLRRTIAEHVLAAKHSAAHVNTVAEADMSVLEAARRRHGAAFKERHGFALSYNAFFLHAAAAALADFPLVNAVLDERGIVTHRRVHLGMAVALEPSGLVVPVLRDAERRSVRAIAVEAQRLTELARARKLTADDMVGGTCTVTNPGVFGNLFGTPIIHVPQVAIVDFGAIKRRVVVLNDDAIAIRPMAYVVLAWDHRAMDGATAARFLQRLVRALETTSVESID